MPGRSPRLISTAFVQGLVCVTLGLTACTNFRASSGSQVVLPADWKNAAGFPVSVPQRDLSRWWRQFNDPVLTKLVGKALDNNRDLASASARVREARARRQSEASTLFPTLSGSTGTNTSLSRSDAGQTSDTRYSLGLNASWEADLFGKNRLSVLAASSEVGAAVENLNTVQASIASEVAQAYLDLRLAEARRSVVRASLKSREDTYQLTTWRQQAGQTDQLELQQAKASLEQANASIPSLEQAVGQTRNRITLLSGLTPGALDGLLGSGRGIPAPGPALAVA